MTSGQQISAQQISGGQVSGNVIEGNPIINDAFAEPTRYWYFAGVAPEIREGRRTAGYRLFCRSREEIVVVRVRPDRGHRLRCPPGCRRRCRFYDAGEGRRRWRALDLGVVRCFLEADAPRVRCLRHGVVTAAVPWARHGARFTMTFEEHAAWRAGLLAHVSADGADWIHDVVREKAPQALICLDAFHVVKWAGEALDKVRRRLAGELRAAGKPDQAASPGKGMWALRKSPGSLSSGQRTALAQIAADNKQLYKGGSGGVGVTAGDLGPYIVLPQVGAGHGPAHRDVHMRCQAPLGFDGVPCGMIKH